MEFEVFGSPGQTAMQIRGEALLMLLDGDPRFCSHGRGVQLDGYHEGSVELAEAVVSLLGATAIEGVPRQDTPDLVEGLAARGYTTDVISLFQADLGATSIAREILASRALPDDLEVRIVDATSPRSLLEAYAKVSVPHGVLPPVGHVMRGVSRPGFAMVAFDTVGRPVATAGAVSRNSPKSAEPGMFQWGQLATTEDRQGEGIALCLGAMAILHAAEMGATGFHTGIRPDNAASERLCTALGVTDSGQDIVIVINPDAFGGARLTK
ncbi:MAG: hypothetical protein AAGF74_03890 [Pseudomonadota bacterium]